MTENRLSHTDKIFHLIAPPDSPIWLPADDLKAWIREWRARGCKTKKDEPTAYHLSRLTEIEAKEARMADLDRKYKRDKAALRKGG